MNGAHDMGGMMGFGPVRPEADEPVFHRAWEARVFAMNIALRTWPIDRARHACERLHPARYLSSSYYEIWLASIEDLLVEGGFATPDEIARGRADHAISPTPTILQVDAVATATVAGNPSARPAGPAPRFAAGDTVRARVANPSGHTRLPRYVRGKVGTVVALHGCHVLPDASAGGLGEAPEPLYTVRFDGTELWGPETDPTLCVSVEAWDSYLEPI